MAGRLWAFAAVLWLCANAAFAAADLRTATVVMHAGVGGPNVQETDGQPLPLARRCGLVVA